MRLITANTILRAAAVAGAIFASVMGATAAKINLNYGSHHASPGGEFVVTARTDGTNAQKAASAAFVAGIVANYSPLATHTVGGRLGFETFCLEYNEHFSPGSNYAYQVSPGAIKGGQTVTDPISVGAAYLYGLFARGVLPGYNYVSSTSAGNLQNTFWYLEGERKGLPAGPLVANPGTFNALLVAEFGADPFVWSADSANSASYGLVNAASFGVAALNLGGGPTWPNQDQLIYQGGGFQRVPDGGATLMLLGFALSGLTLWKRKFA